MAIVPPRLCRSNGQAEIRLCEPWQSEYTGEDATGDHVVALWGFKPGAELEHASGHGHDLVLHDAKVSPDRLFGSCLESFRARPTGPIDPWSGQARETQG